LTAINPNWISKDPHTQGDFMKRLAALTVLFTFIFTLHATAAETVHMIAYGLVKKCLSENNTTSCESFSAFPKTVDIVLKNPTEDSAIYIASGETEFEITDLRKSQVFTVKIRISKGESPFGGVFYSAQASIHRPGETKEYGKIRVRKIQSLDQLNTIELVGSPLIVDPKDPAAFYPVLYLTAK